MRSSHSTALAMGLACALAARVAAAQAPATAQPGAAPPATTPPATAPPATAPPATAPPGATSLPGAPSPPGALSGVTPSLYPAPYLYPYPPPPGAYPWTWARPVEQRYWYGWQTLIVDGVAIVTGLAASVSLPLLYLTGIPVGTGGLVFGGPIVHWAHGNVGKGFGALGIITAAALIGGGVGVGVGCAVKVFESCTGEDAGLSRLIGFMIGLPFGAAIGSAIDVSVLAYGTREVAAPPGRIGTLLPMLDVRRDRAVLGVGAAF